MPRNYVRKTSRGQWTAQQLSNAVLKIREGMSIRKAAVLYAIPYSTLRERLAEDISGAPRFGTKPVFPAETESEIADHCIKMANLFFGLTKLELRKAVYDYAEKKAIPHRFNKEKKLAGNDWLESFLKRHPGISIRQPEATSINRIKAFNKVEVTRFYKNLEEVVTAHNFQPDRIYNFDETGKNLVHKPKSIIAKKGMKRVGAATSGERGKNHTIACAVSAAGHYIPPMIIFPRVRMSANLMIDGPPGTIYRANKSGWITEQLFVEWLAHFKNQTNASTQHPVLLILDNHSTHCSVEAFDFCTDNGIVMLSIPPHTSHRLQPLDLTIFGPLSTAFHEACDTQMKANGYMAMTSEQLPSLLKSAWNKICSTEKAVNGFQSAGICPYNPNVFSDDEFYIEPEIVGIEENSNEIESNIQPTDEYFFQMEVDSAEVEHLEMGHATEEELVNDGFVVVEPVSSETKFCDIVPLPSATNQKKSNRKPREKQHSEIMTSPEYKKVLDEKRKRRDLKEQKKELDGTVQKGKGRDQKEGMDEQMKAVPKKKGRPKKSEADSVKDSGKSNGGKVGSKRGKKKSVKVEGTNQLESFEQFFTANFSCLGGDNPESDSD